METLNLCDPRIALQIIFSFSSFANYTYPLMENNNKKFKMEGICMNMNIDKFIKENHSVVVAEIDVINTLKVINEHHKFPPNMRVGNCGWVNSNKWFIRFDTTRAIWKELIDDLKIVRVFENDDIPDKQVGVVYSTD